MTVRFSTLRSGRDILVLISVRDLVNPRAVLLMEGLGQLKKNQ
jgi:hypothetical protein